MSEWVIVVTHKVRFFSHIIARTSYISMRWWCPLWTGSTTGTLDFYGASSLKQQSMGRHAAPLGNIILILRQVAFGLNSRETTILL